MARARAWPSVVLPTPGTPSISRWPLAKMETKARRRTSSLPRITVRRLASSAPARRAVAIIVSGAISADSTMRAAEAAVTDVTGSRRFDFLCVTLCPLWLRMNAEPQGTQRYTGENPPLKLLPSARHSKQRLYWENSAGLPVRRSILFAVGGWVENRLPKLIPPRNG